MKPKSKWREEREAGARRRADYLARVALAAEMVKGGSSIRAAARQFSVEFMSIRRALDAQGLELRRGHEKLPDNVISTSTKYNRRYQERYPEKRRAHRIVEGAIKSGKLVRGPCADCGAEKTHAHHNDYSVPLDVEWLCEPCHKARHVRAA